MLISTSLEFSAGHWISRGSDLKNQPKEIPQHLESIQLLLSSINQNVAWWFHCSTKFPDDKYKRYYHLEQQGPKVGLLKNLPPKTTGKPPLDHWVNWLPFRPGVDGITRLQCWSADGTRRKHDMNREAASFQIMGSAWFWKRWVMMSSFVRNMHPQLAPWHFGNEVWQMRLWMKELNIRSFKKDNQARYSTADPKMPSSFCFLPSGIWLYLPWIMEMKIVFRCFSPFWFPQFLRSTHTRYTRYCSWIPIPNWKLSPQNMLPKNPGLSVASAVAMAFPRDRCRSFTVGNLRIMVNVAWIFSRMFGIRGFCIISKLKLEDFKRWNFMIGSLFKWVTFWAVKLQLPTVYHSVHLLKDAKPRWSFRFSLEMGFGIQDCWLFPSCFTQNSSRKKSGGNGVFDEMMGFFEVRFSHIFTASPEIRESRQCLEYWCSERCCCFQHGYGMVLPVQQTVLGYSRHTVSFVGQGSYHLDFNMCRNTVFTTIHAMMRICICM